MTSKRGKHTIWLSICLFLISMSQTSSEELYIDRNAVKSSLDSILRQYFADTRFPDTEAHLQYKEAARQYIKSVYQSLDADNERFIWELQTNYESLFDGTHSENMTNYIGIVKGSEYNTSNDQIVLLGAHYDTVPTTPGVDDNGSGISALLEAMSHFKSCTPKHSIMFLAFDLEEYYTTQYFNFGSQRFVDDYLIPNFLFSEESARFRGAYILDTIMNFDPRPQTQIVTPLEEALAWMPNLQPLLDEVTAKNNTGDFIATIGRKTVDDNLSNAFASHFKVGQSSDDHRYYFDIPITSWSTLQNFQDFLRSDHKIFWSKSGENLPNGQTDLPALFITDTANFRKSCIDGSGAPVCQECYHSACDSADRTIDDDNLEFLAGTTEALVRSIAELAECKFPTSAATSPPALVGLVQLVLALVLACSITTLQTA